MKERHFRIADFTVRLPLRFRRAGFTALLPYSMRQQNHTRTSSNRVPTQILDTEVIVRIPVIVDLLTEAERCRDSDRAGQSGTMVCVRGLQSAVRNALDE